METRNRVILLLLILIVIVASALVEINHSFIVNFIGGYIAAYGLSITLLVCFFGEIIDQPFGADVLAVLGVSFGLNSYLVYGFAVLGCWSASLFNFYIGRRYLSRTISQSCSTERYGNYCRLYKKYGKIAIAFSALVFPYIIMTWVSGALGLRLGDFILYGLLARALRIGVVLLLALGVIHLFGL